MLAAAMGSTVRLEVDGPDEDAAMSALVQLLDKGLTQRR
jgi:phosphotransferase system HPr-like phosphotransfer protein